MVRKLAIVLFNLGGPDGPDDVQPFLKNLFSDPAIIRAPAPIRWMLARFISMSRAKSARANYAKMGGGSPLVPETNLQARALEAAVKRLPGYESSDVRAFLAMRYWKPFTQDAVAAVKDFDPDQIVLLPLYPQFSTTTTDSSLKAWTKAGGPPAKMVCCYPDAPGFIEAHRQNVMEAWNEGGTPTRVRILWSAHGLPETVIASGDPYQRQVEETVEALKPLLPDHFEHVVCYQSKVGPLKWITPSTEEEIERAAADKIGILVVPIAFVSEHIETLVELDDEYREKADHLGVPFYLRAKALGVNTTFINELARLTDQVLTGDELILAARTGSCGTPCPACPRGYVGGCATA